MPNFVCASPGPLFYADIVGPDGSLIAQAGDVVEFDSPPSDGNWYETDAPVTDVSGRSWPIIPASQQPDPATEQAAAPAAELVNDSNPFAQYSA